MKWKKLDWKIARAMVLLLYDTIVKIGTCIGRNVCK